MNLSWLVYNNVLALGFGTVAGIWFVTLYSVRTPWWREEHRAHLGIFSIIMTLFYVLYAVRTFSQPLNAPGSSITTFNVIRGLLFDLLTAAVVWRLALLLRARPKLVPVD